MTTHSWDELTLVYDEKFKILESGRLAYSQAMADTLASIRRELSCSSPPSEAPGNLATIQMEPYPKLDHPAALFRKVLAYIITIGEDRICVLVRFSAPWEGSSGLLQFVLESKLDSRWTESLRKMVCSHELGKRAPQENLEENPDWIGSGSLSLSEPNLIPSASKALRAWAHLGWEAVRRLRNQDLGYKLKCIFDEAKSALKTAISQRFPNSYLELTSFTPKGHDIRYIELWLPNRDGLGLWVGYETNKHFVAFGCDGFADDAVADKLGRAISEKIGPIEKLNWEPSKAWRVFDTATVNCLEEGALSGKIGTIFEAFFTS